MPEIYWENGEIIIENLPGEIRSAYEEHQREYGE